MTCETCGNEKKRYGVYTCIDCRKAYLLKWRSENRDRWNAKSREWVDRNKEKRKAIVKKSESRNREEHLEKRRIAYAEGRRRKDYKVSPEVRLTIKNRRRARLANVPHDSYDPKDIFEKFDFKCHYCGEDANCLDHVVPISRGGWDTISNLVAACRPCNTSKSNKMLEEWKRQKKRVRAN